MGCEYSVWDLNEESTVDPVDFVSMGKATPFEGWRISGKCIATVCDGKIVYQA
jgi:dihydroorotase